MSNMKDTPSKLIYQPVAGFVEQIAAKSPAPGGGSAAALSGAIGAGLLVMVCEFTIGKKGFESVTELLTSTKNRIDALRHLLTRQVDLDTWAFNRFRVANRLPETTTEEKEFKAREIAESTMATIEVPRQTMQQCLAALSDASIVIQNGNPNTLSDAATGAEMLVAGLEGAANNVLINLLEREDDEAAKLRIEVREARSASRKILDELRTFVSTKLRG